jgi:hypothetical protein
LLRKRAACKWAELGGFTAKQRLPPHTQNNDDDQIGICHVRALHMIAPLSNYQ